MARSLKEQLDVAAAEQAEIVQQKLKALRDQADQVRKASPS